MKEPTHDAPEGPRTNGTEEPLIVPASDISSDASSDAWSGAAARAVAVLRAGGVIAFPTDTLYGIGCAFDRRRAIERVLGMRGIDRSRRPLTFLIPDLGELARYAQVTEVGHAILSRIFPGPYCVELIAADSIPDPYAVGQRRTIGVRIPAHQFCEKMLWALGTPVLTATAKGRDGRVLTSAADISAVYGADLDLIVDGGVLNGPPSTVLSLVDEWVTVLRRGRGPVV